MMLLVVWMQVMFLLPTPTLCAAGRYIKQTFTAPGKIRDGYIASAADIGRPTWNSHFACARFASSIGGPIFISCLGETSVPYCTVAHDYIDPTIHFEPDDAYKNCLVFSESEVLVEPITPKTKKDHLTTAKTSTGTQEYLSTNNFCTSEGWVFGSIMSTQDLATYDAEVKDEARARCVNACRIWVYFDVATLNWDGGDPLNTTVLSLDTITKSCMMKNWSGDFLVNYSCSHESVPVLCQEFIV